MAPFKYTSIVWATAIGFVVYGTLPDGQVMAGAALVILSGLYILHRERRQSAQRSG